MLLYYLSTKSDCSDRHLYAFSVVGISNLNTKLFLYSKHRTEIYILERSRILGVTMKYDDLFFLHTKLCKYIDSRLYLSRSTHTRGENYRLMKTCNLLQVWIVCDLTRGNLPKSQMKGRQEIHTIKIESGREEPYTLLHTIFDQFKMLFG